MGDPAGQGGIMSSRSHSLMVAREKRRKLVSQCNAHGIIPATMGTSKKYGTNPKTGRPYKRGGKSTTMGKMRRVLRDRGIQPIV